MLTEAILTDKPEPIHYIWRLVSTFISAGFYWLITNAYTPVATIIAGQEAGNQFVPSDSDYVQAVWANSLLSGVNGILSLIFGLVLMAIWFDPVKRGIKFVLAALAAGGMLVAVMPNTAHAFAEKADRTEAYTILPNESAFWIPDVGDNKSKEAQIDSADYLNANKVALTSSPP